MRKWKSVALKINHTIVILSSAAWCKQCTCTDHAHNSYIRHDGRVGFWWKFESLQCHHLKHGLEYTNWNTWRMKEITWIGYIPIGNTWNMKEKTGLDIYQ